ncbi:MAG: DUF6941 family protein [Elusimicrobiota bacterium]
MQVSDMVLARYAGVDEAGRSAVVQGVLTTVLTDRLPCVVPSLYMLLRLTAGPQDRGVNRIAIRLVGRQGSSLQAEGALTVVEDGDDDPHFSMPVHFHNTTFGSEGRFDFEVSINGRLEAARPFYIKRTARNSPSSARDDQERG